MYRLENKKVLYLNASTTVINLDVLPFVFFVCFHVHLQQHVSLCRESKFGRVEVAATARERRRQGTLGAHFLLYGIAGGVSQSYLMLVPGCKRYIYMHGAGERAPGVCQLRWGYCLCFFRPRQICAHPGATCQRKRGGGSGRIGMTKVSEVFAWQRVLLIVFPWKPAHFHDSMREEYHINSIQA